MIVTMIVFHLRHFSAKQQQQTNNSISECFTEHDFQEYVKNHSRLGNYDLQKQHK
jgi:hypothetical protein